MLNPVSVVVSLILLTCFPLKALFSQDVSLATQVQTILENRCASCHGNGQIDGGFGFVQSRRRLVQRLVKPGQPNRSKLYEVVRAGRMPADDEPLPKNEQDLLRQWIEMGAPDWGGAPQPRPFITPETMFDLIRDDLTAQPERNRHFIRYFTITHLHNHDELYAAELESYRRSLSKLVNSLSWGRRIEPPVAIDAHKTILRIDVRDYKWNENDAWTKIAEADPYRVEYDFPSATFVYEATGTRSPMIRADWFFFAASRPPLYHELLAIPPTDLELERRLAVNVKRNIRDLRAVRAGFFPSGVSKNNRLIERHESAYGAYWKSYDFAGNRNQQNLFAHPLGPEGENGFKHDGGEIIFSLPNGLQAYMLVDSKGERIDKGPTSIVVDKPAVASGRDPDVVNGISCMGCHSRGMIEKSDMVRAAVASAADSFSRKQLEEIRALYIEPSEMTKLLQEDSERFAEAVELCGASLGRTEPVVALSRRFDEPVRIGMAAAEAGLQVDKFAELLRKSAPLSRALGNLLQPGGAVGRDTFALNFPSIVRELPSVRSITTDRVITLPDERHLRLTKLILREKTGELLVLSKNAGARDYDDSTVVDIVDVATGRLLRQLDHELVFGRSEFQIQDIAASRSGPVATLAERTGIMSPAGIQIWDPRTGKLLQKISLNSLPAPKGFSPVGTIDISEDGRFVIVPFQLFGLGNLSRDRWEQWKKTRVFPGLTSEFSLLIDVEQGELLKFIPSSERVQFISKNRIVMFAGRAQQMQVQIRREIDSFKKLSYELYRITDVSSLRSLSSLTLSVPVSDKIAEIGGVSSDGSRLLTESMIYDTQTNRPVARLGRYQTSLTPNGLHAIGFGPATRDPTPEEISAAESKKPSGKESTGQYFSRINAARRPIAIGGDQLFVFDARSGRQIKELATPLQNASRHGNVKFALGDIGESVVVPTKDGLRIISLDGPAWKSKDAGDP